MATQEASTTTSPEGTLGDAIGSSSESIWAQQENSGVSQRPSTSATDASISSIQPGKQTTPMPKRRRVTRACDECRRKKIKCDGRQPCTHCTVYSYECTYDQPSNRRRNPAPQYIEALETRLQKTEAILRIVAPDIDIDDPKFDALLPHQILASRKGSQDASATAETKASTSVESGDESLLESMMENTGTLDLDEQGHWDYHGQSSSVLFMRRFREQFKDLKLTDPLPKARPTMAQILPSFDSPVSFSDSPKDGFLVSLQDLPSRELAEELCKNALNQACALMRFIHQPSFWRMFNSVYDKPVELHGNEENKFLPLLYSCLALGCLFETAENSTLDQQGYKGAIEQGVQYFKIGRQMIDITDCRDLVSLQTILIMILFLQSSARLSTCYSYIGVALRSALRLGLHRSFKAGFNPVELETRRRVFWTIRKMDGYVGALLGLPQMLGEDDIDQEYPTEVDDEYITAEGIIPMPEGKYCMMAGVNAHTKLIRVLTKVVKYIYPIKASEARQNSKFTQSSLVSHAKIREIEKELQDWMERLPMELRPSEDATGDRARMQQLLRSSYAYVQIILYRPFLHYVRRNADGVDKRSYACAAACVSVSRNSIHITTQMKSRGLLTGAYWFSMFTTYFSILSLLYYVLENPDSQTSDELLKDAMEGKETLASLAKRSLAADRCTQSLNSFFEDLPEKIQGRKSVTSTPKSRKRVSSPNPFGKGNTPQRSNSLKLNQPFGGVQRAKTYPTTVDSQGAVRRSPSHIELDSSKIQRNEHMTGLVKKEALSASDSPNVPSAPSTGSLSSGPNVSPDYLTVSGDSIAANDTGITFPDFSSMMFPSGDPFAYPNQPMSMLEDDQFRGDQMNLSLADAKGTPFLQSNHSVPHPSYQGLHDPLFAPNFSFAMPSTMPGYITPTSAASTTPLSMAANRLSNADPMAMPAQFWQQPQSQHQQQPTQMMASDMNIDDLISGATGDWSGQSWMDTNTGN